MLLTKLDVEYRNELGWFGLRKQKNSWEPYTEQNWGKQKEKRYVMRNVERICNESKINATEDWLKPQNISTEQSNKGN